MKTSSKILDVTFSTGISLVFLFLASISTQVNAQNISDTEESFTAFKEVLTAQDISEYGDLTVEQAISRLVGIQVSKDGTPNLRGAGINNFYVTINGQRFATNGFGNRSYDLGSISVDAISSIEYIKVLTPDMAADGLAGIINIVTLRPLKESKLISAGISGGAIPNYFNRIGPSGTVWARYSEPVSDKTNIALNVSYLNDQKVAQNIGLRYGVEDFGSGNVDVLEGLSPSLRLESRTQYSGSIQLDYNPSDKSFLYLQGFLNTDNRQINNHSNSWLANGDWINQTTVGSQGSYTYALNTTQQSISQYTFKAGGQNQISQLLLEYSLGYSQNKIESEEHVFPFEETGFEYTVDFSNRERPALSPVNEIPQVSDMTLETLNLIVNHHIDKTFTTNIDLSIPISNGTIKFGGSTLMMRKDASDDGAYSKYDYDYRGTLFLDGFEAEDKSTARVFNNGYLIPRIINSDEALSFFESSIPNMRLDTELFHLNSDIRNYFSTEDVYSAYAMTDLTVGKLQILAGLRFEQTSSNYEGKVVAFNRFDQYDETRDTSNTTNYSNIFPNAQLSFDLNSRSRINAAYSKTLSRPDFNFLAPFELITATDTSIFAGNSNLKPITSDNFDLNFDFKYATSGKIEVGVFYKIITNNIEIEETEFSATEGDYAVFDPYFDGTTSQISATQRTYANKDEATNLYGIEVSVEQKFTALPTFLSNFGTLLNYTWTDSEYSAKRGTTETLPNQRKHVLNAALTYQDKKFYSQVSYHLSGKALTSIQQQTQLAPSLSQQAYFDTYDEGWQDLSINSRYKISSQFSIWANIYNVLANESIEYATDSEFYPTSVYKRTGIEFYFGLRFDL